MEKSIVGNKVLYIGHGLCGRKGLERIFEREYDKEMDIFCVVNHRETSDNPDTVRDFARNKNILVYEGNINSPEFIESVSNQKPDFGIIMRYPVKISPRFFNLFRKGIFNMHPTDLPKHKGIAPIEHLVSEGGPLVATAIRISKKFDSGPILAKTPGTDISGLFLEEVYPLAVQECVEVMDLAIQNLIFGNGALQESDQSIESYARRKDLPKRLNLNFLEDSCLDLYRKLLARGKDGTTLEVVNNCLNERLKVRVKSYDNSARGAKGTIRRNMLFVRDGGIVFEELRGQTLHSTEVKYEFEQKY
jgi:methionyl-tRNA formyltransferase